MVCPCLLRMACFLKHDVNDEGEVQTMPKQKTHKGMKKRFKVTGTGKIKHRKANRGHKLSHKNGRRRRRLRGDGVIEGTEAKKVIAALLPGL